MLRVLLYIATSGQWFADLGRITIVRLVAGMFALLLFVQGVLSFVDSKDIESINQPVEQAKREFSQIGSNKYREPLEIASEEQSTPSGTLTFDRSATEESRLHSQSSASKQQARPNDERVSPAPLQFESAQNSNAVSSDLRVHGSEKFVFEEPGD